MSPYGTHFKFKNVNLRSTDCLNMFDEFLENNQCKVKIEKCYLFDTAKNEVIYCMNDEVLHRELYGNDRMSREQVDYVHRLDTDIDMSFDDNVSRSRLRDIREDMFQCDDQITAWNKLRIIHITRILASSFSSYA